MTTNDLQRLRELARKQLEYAHSPRNEQIIQQWQALAEGRRENPTIRLLYNNFRDEVITPRLMCQDEDARQLEQQLLSTLVGRELFDDDTPSEQAQSNESAQQKENPQSENINPQEERFCSHSDIEINNKYRDKQQEITETNSGGVSANAEPPASIAKASKPIVYDGFVF